MHSPPIILAMLLGTIGVPVAGLYLLTFIGSLMFKRTRAFAGRVFLRALGVGLVVSAVMWLFAILSLPAPFHYQAALTVFPFGFGVGGIALFFWFLSTRKSGEQNEAV